MKAFEDIYHVSMNKAGEELCGDQVRIIRTEEKTRLVLSDGMGSGVKANILACLTVEIIAKMLQEGASLSDVIETIAGTLPVCKERNLAYATFTVIEIDHDTLDFHAYNFDNPPLFFYRGEQYCQLPFHIESILGRDIQIYESRLQYGDFVAAISDGILFAGLGAKYNFGWGFENIARYMENLFAYHPNSAKAVVQRTASHTLDLYGAQPGDDASILGILIRPSLEAVVFTGPPLDEAEAPVIADRVLQFQGARIVCGGSTGNIVAERCGRVIQTDITTLEKDIPPIGRLPGIDLLTEGILTMSQACEWLGQSEGDPGSLPRRNNGAIMLAKALLNADEILFIVGQKTNPFYQNPLLPSSVSIRSNVVEKMAAHLTRFHKKVQIEYH